ncbi:MAG: hypothetical protein KDE26_32800, partial [Bacteroidetes bacterium]|nr:hypothetical protein [Bacteroidota bacterium]
PQWGRYDAGEGLWLKGNGSGDFTAVLPSVSGFELEGEIRDIKVMPRPGQEPLILAGRNNGGIQMFQLKQ